jgi:hypothetical protein
MIKKNGGWNRMDPARQSRNETASASSAKSSSAFNFFNAEDAEAYAEAYAEGAEKPSGAPTLSRAVRVSKRLAGSLTVAARLKYAGRHFGFPASSKRPQIRGISIGGRFESAGKLDHPFPCPFPYTTFRPGLFSMMPLEMA